MKARLPLFTIGACAVALVLGLSPSWSASLQLERSALATHEYWRLLGAHFTHWSAGHLACQLAAFLACGWYVERRSHLVMISTTMLSALLVSLAVLTFAPEIAMYRGLSGIVAGLFAAATIDLLQRARTARSVLAGSLAIAAVVSLVGKTLFEFNGGPTPMAIASGDSAPVPIAHLAGIVAGLCGSLLLVVRARRDRAAPSRSHGRRPTTTPGPRGSADAIRTPSV